jgi:hypothetical protein
MAQAQSDFDRRTASSSGFSRRICEVTPSWSRMSAMTQQNQHDIRLPRTCSDDKRSQAGASRLVDLESFVQQKIKSLYIVVFHGELQRCFVKGIFRQ